MFFCHEILQRRNGSLGIIWLAAMQNKSLTRREYEKVVITKKCQEIMAYITAQSRSAGGKTRRFSLYLSAQLVYGTSKVLLQQRKYLLMDCAEAHKKLKLHENRRTVDIPQSAVKRKRDLCLAEDFAELHVSVSDDASLIPLLIPLSVPLIQETIDFLREDEPNEATLTDVTVNTAPKHAITMSDQANAESTLYPSFQQVAPGMDLAPMGAGELDQLLAEMAVSPIKHVPEPEMAPPSQLEVEGMSAAVPTPTIQNQLEQTPAIEPVGPAGDGVPSKHNKRREDEETLIENQPSAKRRRTIPLVLPPLEEEQNVSHRVVRRTRLIIDSVIRNSKETCREWYENSDKTSRPAILPTMKTSRIEDLMTTPGCTGNYNSVDMKAWFAKMCDTRHVTAVIPMNDEDEEAQLRKHDSANQTGELGRNTSASRVPSVANTSALQHSTNAPANVSGGRSLALVSCPSTPAAVEKTQRLATHDVPLPEQVGVSELAALPLVDEQMIVDEQAMVVGADDVPAAASVDPTVPAEGPARESIEPPLVIQSEADIMNAQEAPAATPLSMSAQARLFRSIKANTQMQNEVAFTDLDIIQAGKTSRLEVARYFHCLLSLAKNRRVQLTQEEPFAPVNIQPIHMDTAR